MIKTIQIFNPLSKSFQKMVDINDLAEKDHEHLEINVLNNLINHLIETNQINLKGGYFIN
jgi:hypothetical protein